MVKKERERERERAGQKHFKLNYFILAVCLSVCLPACLQMDQTELCWDKSTSLISWWAWSLYKMYHKKNSQLSHKMTEYVYMMLESLVWLTHTYIVPLGINGLIVAREHELPIQELSIKRVTLLKTLRVSSRFMIWSSISQLATDTKPAGKQSCG